VFSIISQLRIERLKHMIPLSLRKGYQRLESGVGAKKESALRAESTVIVAREDVM
jgi:hypothetical protein